MVSAGFWPSEGARRAAFALGGDKRSLCPLVVAIPAEVCPSRCQAARGVRKAALYKASAYILPPPGAAILRRRREGHGD